MSQQADIENDPFLVLLTDALRAGPGSPEWHDAVASLKTAGGEVDEYQMLIEARAALADGRDYRSVRAGPDFTRKLLTNIDQHEQAAAPRKFPIATIVAVLAGLVVIAGLALAGFELSRHGQLNDGKRAVDDLASTYFPTDVLAGNFDKGIAMSWRQIGILPVEARNGLRPVASEAVTNPVGGGIVTVDSLPAEQPFAVQVTLHIGHSDENLIPQIFISNTADFSADRAISAHEVVWQLRGKQQEVVVDGRVEPPHSLPAHSETLTVRLIFNRDLAIVESGNGRLWAGPNRLGDSPRYVGIRFLHTSGKADAGIAIQSFRIQKN